MSEAACWSEEGRQGVLASSGKTPMQQRQSSPTHLLHAQRGALLLVVWNHGRGQALQAGVAPCRQLPPTGHLVGRHREQPRQQLGQQLVPACAGMHAAAGRGRRVGVSQQRKSSLSPAITRSRASALSRDTSQQARSKQARSLSTPTHGSTYE